MIPMSESEYRMLNNTPSEGDLFSASTSSKAAENRPTSQVFRPTYSQRLRNFVTTRRNLAIAISVTTLVVVVAVIAIAVGVTQGKKDDDGGGNGGSGNGSKSMALYSACGGAVGVGGAKTPVVKTQYTLSKEFVGDDFFSFFDFFTYDDPTGGVVNYVSFEEASNEGLIEVKNAGDKKQIYIGTDSTNNVADGERGRNSVRIQTKQSWNANPALLFLMDIDHMPAACGAWPAWWMVGPQWPEGGEIDIIEGVNLNSANQMALHTGPSCNMNDQTKLGQGECFAADWASGVEQTIAATNCFVEEEKQWYNQGCSQIWTNQTFGSSLNDKKGGVFAMEWNLLPTGESGFIRSFFLSREFVEANADQFDGSATTIDTSKWGSPQSVFILDPNDCKPTNFKDLSIVINLTFCGDWAAEAYNWSKCKERTKVDTCQEFVKKNPKAFKEAYWLINSLRVYQGSH